MKLTLTTAIIGAAAFGAVAATAGHHEGEGAKTWETKLEAKFAEIDADADGAVSEAEYLEYKAAEARKSFVEMGGDDGTVTLDEAKQAYAAKRAEKKAKMKERKEMKDGMSDKADADKPHGSDH